MKSKIIYTAPIIGTGLILGFPDVCSAEPVDPSSLEEIEEESSSLNMEANLSAEGVNSECKRRKVISRVS